MVGRYDTAFKSTRPQFHQVNTTKYYNNDHTKDNLPKLETRYDPPSIQYTKIRNKNSSFNPCHYGRSPLISLRPEMDKDTDEKQYCKNPYATQTFNLYRNGDVKKHPDDIMKGIGNMDKSIIYSSPDKIARVKHYAPAGTTQYFI